MSEWIMVEDQLPAVPQQAGDWEFDGRSASVLCLAPCGTMFVGYYRVDYDQPEWSCWVQGGRDAYTDVEPVAWMPLPDPP